MQMKFQSREWDRNRQAKRKNELGMCDDQADTVAQDKRYYERYSF